MAEGVLRALTPHQRQVLGPEVGRLAELEEAVARQRELVRRMLALLEPRFAAGEPGVRFDAGRMAFVHGEAEEEGRGDDDAAAAPTSSVQAAAGGGGEGWEG